MKGEHEVRPAVALKDAVGTGSALHAPADAFQGLPGRDGAVTIVIGSCSDKELAELGDGFPVFEPVGERAKGERFYLGLGFFLGSTVGHDAGQGRDLGDPTAIVLAIELDA